MQGRRIKDVVIVLGPASDKNDVIQQLNRRGEGGEIFDIWETEPSQLLYCPKCGSGVWDRATQDQRLNKCWGCGLRFDSQERADLPNSNLEQFKDEEHLSAVQKTKLYKRFRMFLNALANPSDTDFDAETGSCPANVYKTFSNDLYEHSHMHIGGSAHYNKAGYCGNYFNSYEGIEEYMDHLGKYSRSYDMYGDVNNAMYQLWLPMKQKIRWAWMNKK